MNPDHSLECILGISRIFRKCIKAEFIASWGCSQSIDSRQGYLSRTGLCKALALVAFAQQGKPVSEKLIQNFAGE
ncbi:hypothetical protein TNCV_2136301, partial [Trichonephila clavipes]